MTTYTRQMISFKRGSRERTTYNEYYTQPRADRLKYRAFHTFDTVINHKPLRYLTLYVESLDLARHKRTCDDNCTWATRASDDERIQICGFMPLTNRMDCICFELDRKNNHKVLRS